VLLNAASRRSEWASEATATPFDHRNAWQLRLHYHDDDRLPRSSAMPDKPPRVFISYAQEGEAHAAWVRALADELIRDGIDTVIDQREEWPEQGWRRWMDKQIAAADWVLVVCTTEYRRRFDDNADAPSPEGRGVRWESQHITQELYDRKFRNRRFVPVLPPTADEADIPVPLQDYRKFRLGDAFQIRADDCDHEGFTALYRLLTGQPAYPAPEPGGIRPLPPLTQAAVQRQGAQSRGLRLRASSTFRTRTPVLQPSAPTASVSSLVGMRTSRGSSRDSPKGSSSAWSVVPGAASRPWSRRVSSLRCAGTIRA
jgi:hypothetical protein